MDQSLQILINREWTTPWADRLFAWIADFGSWAPWLAVAVVLGLLFGDFRFRSMIVAAALGVGLSDGIGVNALKHAVGRPRPSQVEPGVRMVSQGTPPGALPRICGFLSDPVVAYPHGIETPPVPGMLIDSQPHEGRSFPSGHASNNMALATVLLLFYPRRGWLYLPVALLIGYSRIYTGSHWPSDVAAGMFLGISGGWLAVVLLRNLWRSLAPRLFPALSSVHPELLASSPTECAGDHGNIR